LRGKEAHRGRDYPRNQEEFRRFFPNERACELFLGAMRWPDGFACPKCSAADLIVGRRYWLTVSGLFQCCDCRSRISVTSSTVLDKTRLPLLKWLTAIWYVTEERNGVSALSLQRSLALGSY
jgi:hypothetical protein